MTRATERQDPSGREPHRPLAFPHSVPYLLVGWVIGLVPLVVTPVVVFGLGGLDADDISELGIPGWILAALCVVMWVAFAALLVKLTRMWLTQRRYFRRGDTGGDA